MNLVNFAKLQFCFSQCLVKKSLDTPLVILKRPFKLKRKLDGAQFTFDLYAYNVYLFICVYTMHCSFFRSNIAIENLKLLLNS